MYKNITEKNYDFTSEITLSKEMFIGSKVSSKLN